MGIDLWLTAETCALSLRAGGSKAVHQAEFKLFLSRFSLEFITSDITGLLTVRIHGKKFILVISDIFTKPTRSIHMRSTTATDVAMA